MTIKKKSQNKCHDCFEQVFNMISNNLIEIVFSPMLLDKYAEFIYLPISFLKICFSP